MPVYEYRCEKGHTFEVMQRMSDDPIMSCTTCEAPVQRVFHPVAVHFKGSGFYATDYGRRKKSGSSSDEAGGSGTSTDSAAKKDTSGEKSGSPGKTDSGSSGSSGSSSSSD